MSEASQLERLVSRQLLGDERTRAQETIKRNHYTRSVPSGKSHYVQFGDAIVVWSIPANKNIARFVLGWPGNVWELSRLWAPDGHEKNLLTQAISAAVKVIVKLERPDALVSYADPNAGHNAMNTLMPAPVAKPQIGKQAVAARLRAGAHFSSSRVHACESSLAGLPGLYSGSFYSARSVRKAMGPLESPKSESPLRKQRAFYQPQPRKLK